MADNNRKNNTWKYAGWGVFAVSAMALWKIRGASAYAARASKYKDYGKETVIITGGESGLGYRAAEHLACYRTRLILACKNQAEGEKAAESLRKQVGNYNIVAMECDLSSFDSIRKFAKDINATEEKISVLVNNAAVLLPEEERTKDGIEMQMGVNYFGHFLLTNLLLPKMMNPLENNRIVFVSDFQGKYGRLDFTDLKGNKSIHDRSAYYDSKLALNLLSIELAKRGAQYGINTYCVEPRLSQTGLAKNVKFEPWEKILYALTARSDELGCQAILDAVVNEDIEEQTGNYYTNCLSRPWQENTVNYLPDAGKLWERSMEITHLEETI